MLTFLEILNGMGNVSLGIRKLYKHTHGWNLNRFYHDCSSMVQNRGYHFLDILAARGVSRVNFMCREFMAALNIELLRLSGYILQFLKAVTSYS